MYKQRSNRRFNQRRRNAVVTKKYDYTHKVARFEANKVINKNVESKIWNARLPGTAVDYSGSVWRLFSNPTPSSDPAVITQGTNDNEYIGKKVHVSHILAYIEGIAADSSNVFTVIIFQNRGTFNPISNTMTNVFQSTGNIEAPLSFPDVQYNDRFRILYRKTFAISSSSDVSKVFRIKISGKKIRPTLFADASGTAENGDLWLGVISDSSASTHPAIHAQWRLYYKDA